MSDKEKISGDYFTVTKTGNFTGGYWNIILSNRDIMFTCPASVGQEKIDRIMSIYERDLWGSYIMASSKRYCVAVKDLDINKLENSIISVL